MKAESALTTIGGIHHITSIAADPKRTQEFYAGTLGLHLVRKTVNFDEPSVLHFYFGDRRGSPGSMITFFVHGAEPPGLCGPGHISSIAFAVPFGTLQSWHLCLSKIKSGHIGGAARRELGGKESAQPVRRRARTAHPSPRRDACARHCNISCTTAAGDGGGTRRARRRGRGIPVGSDRSGVRRIRFAMGNAAMSADRECPLIESVG